MDRRVRFCFNWVLQLWYTSGSSKKFDLHGSEDAIMKAIVCIKQVPDTETKIKLNGDASGVDLAGVKWVMNPYDEFAVEEALKRREAGQVTQVVVITVGPKTRGVEVLRTALAMGADEAVVVDAPESADSSVVARALSAAIRLEGESRIVLMGKLAIDDNQSAVPQMVAESLGIAHATVISKLDLQTTLMAERDIEGGAKETLEIRGPAVLSANKGLNTPRYTTLPGIMKAKKKTIKELDLAGLGVSATASTRLGQFQLPPDRAPVRMLTGDSAAQVRELVRSLREDAKVI